MHIYFIYRESYFYFIGREYLPLLYDYDADLVTWCSDAFHKIGSLQIKKNKKEKTSMNQTPGRGPLSHLME